MRFELEHEGDLPSIEGVIEKLTFAKNRALSSAELTSYDAFTKKLFERLQTCMRAYNAVDFDNLLTLMVRLFEEFPDVVKKYQQQFRYIMIDEYQDTNPIQYRLAERLAQGHNNLCVVGDDDQSIYGWRGAEVKNILEFAPQMTVKLEQNYRSTPTILKAAHAVIAKNSERLGKELWSRKEMGEQITLFHAPTEEDEAQAVVDRVAFLHRERGIAWKDMAILYRSNTQVRVLEVALMQAAWQKEGNWVRGIPYQVFGGTEFYERSEIKDLIAYLRVIVNPSDQEALLRIINTPRRGISDQTLDLLTQINRKENIPLWKLLKEIPAALADQLSDRGKKGIASFVQIVESAQAKFAQEPLGSSLEWLTERIDYKKAIAEDVKSEKMQDFKWENVTYCIETLKNYENTCKEQNQDSSLHDFLTNTLLDNSGPKRKEKTFKENKLNLMTFHGAKGLEFEVCFLIGLEDHLLPHEKSIGTRGVEEERRLFYVAMTRAKTKLTLTMARSRKRMGKDSPSNPSRFLHEIPKELVRIGSWKVPD